MEAWEAATVHKTTPAPPHTHTHKRITSNAKIQKPCFYTQINFKSAFFPTQRLDFRALLWRLDFLNQQIRIIRSIFFLSIGVSLSFSMKFSVCSFVDVLETHQN